MEEIVSWFETHPGTAGWVQAAGTILALAISIGLAWWQSWRAEKSAAAEKLKDTRRLIEAVTAVSDYAQCVFISTLEGLRGPKPFESLDHEGWLESISRMVRVVDSLPIHQLPDFESIQLGLEIQQYIHVLTRNVADLAREALANQGGDFSPHLTLIEKNLSALEKLNTEFHAMGKSLET